MLRKQFRTKKYISSRYYTGLEIQNGEELRFDLIFTNNFWQNIKRPYNENSMYVQLNRNSSNLAVCTLDLADSAERILQN